VTGVEGPARVVRNRRASGRLVRGPIGRGWDYVKSLSAPSLAILDSIYERATSVPGTSPASTRSTFMTNDDTIATVGSDEQRIDSATDAIRGMSHDLANEVAPPLTWLDRVSAATREAPVQ
jgi:hypothetical protein